VHALPADVDREGRHLTAWFLTAWPLHCPLRQAWWFPQSRDRSGQEPELPGCLIAHLHGHTHADSRLLAFHSSAEPSCLDEVHASRGLVQSGQLLTRTRPLLLAVHGAGLISEALDWTRQGKRDGQAFMDGVQSSHHCIGALGDCRGRV